MYYNRFLLAALILSAVILASCSDGLKADNGLTYDNVPGDVKNKVESTEIVHLVIRVEHEQINAQYQQSPASGSGVATNSYASMSYTGQIIDGKGIMLVYVINGPEKYHGFMILKFVDLKAMALQPGYRANVSCVVDYELLNPAKDRTNFTDDALTYELDDCRLDTPSVTPVGVE